MVIKVLPSKRLFVCHVDVTEKRVNENQAENVAEHTAFRSRYPLCPPFSQTEEPSSLAVRH